ncbi:hypothetical protein BDK51DRAFT_50078 [Blyttiomyces helicus]|uniref:Uncharacterized protein n=1 Tax=Blyttiomyces helicus TaxID=388810 RepID=A0A4P9VWQ9_9FUNG|nr:hypothetical protein BDK51DRAFT_50078 [Blyttiomyces helicus]|eukprot:RKO83295.1 hypothetical protein BDK51DRAFT_50078 [Blyttiomyces helicus]
MAKKHGFFIPDAEFLADIPGLLDYLRESSTATAIASGVIGPSNAPRRFASTWPMQPANYEDAGLGRFYDFSLELDESEIADERNLSPGPFDSFFTSSLPAPPAANDPQLTLPSGTKIGRRQHARIWRQTLPPSAEHALVFARRPESSRTVPTRKGAPRGRDAGQGTADHAAEVPGPDVV